MAAGKQTAVVITGASTGIGEACALHLALKGFKIYAGYRKPADAEKLSKLSDNIRPVRLDVTDELTIHNAFKEIEALNIPVSGLVNNAGIAIGGPLEVLPVSDLRWQLEVNVIGQIAVTQSCLPLLRKASQAGHSARLVNMGSVAGLSSIPFAGPYAASKFALEALTDSLRIELKPWNIGVSIIEPGVIATPIWEKSLGNAGDTRARIPADKLSLYEKALDNFLKATHESVSSGIPAEEVAKAVAHALTSPRPKTRYLVGPDAQIRPFFASLPDGLKDWLLMKKIGLTV